MAAEDLRSSMRKARQALGAAKREEAAWACVQFALGLDEVRRARCIAAYVAHRGEVSCEPLIDWALGRGASMLLPVVTGRRMRFAPHDPAEELAPNRWGIPEPKWRPGRWVSARRPSVVFLPLTAFDGQGNRLGQGGGYYDRAFAFRLHAEHWRRPLLVGLAYEFQRTGALQAKPTDVPLDAVITERRIYEFAR